MISHMPNEKTIKSFKFVDGGVHIDDFPYFKKFLRSTWAHI